MKTHTIVLATHNRDKQREILALLNGLPVKLLTLEDFPAVGAIPEPGSTLLENALHKARTVHAQTGLPAMADDTGLEVDALNGAPGIYAARFAGPEATYDDNVEKLLRELASVPPDQRTATFRTVVAYVDQSQELWTEGAIKGMIAKTRQGAGGFGYDPVFYVPEQNKTLAEMSPAEKNRISHRGRALREMCALLTRDLFH
jgi:XTP/dITP diphosphohydrolase